MFRWRVGLFIAVLASCSPDTPKLIPVHPEPTSKVTHPPLKVEFNPQIDILFVIDDSGSMDAHQRNLETNISSFVDAITKNTVLDYHIGVITTDDFDKKRKGRLYGQPTFVTKQTPNGLQALRRNLIPGTYGAVNEMIFAPVMEALSPPLTTVENAGFYRADAYLAIIVITDTDDQTYNVSPDQFYQFLLDLKGGQADKVLFYGVLAPILDSPQCPRDDYDRGRLRKVLDLAQGYSFNICSTNFGLEVGKIGVDVASKVTKFIVLESRPILSTIEVRYGGELLPNDLKTGWVYDPKKNALRFGDEVALNSQAVSSKLEITYTPDDLAD